MKNYSKIISLALASTFVLGIGMSSNSVSVKAEEETKTSETVLKEPAQILDKDKINEFESSKEKEMNAMKDQSFGLTGKEEEKSQAQKTEKIYAKSFQPKGYLGFWSVTNGLNLNQNASSDFLEYQNIRLYKSPLGEMKDPSKDAMVMGYLRSEETSKLMAITGLNSVGQAVNMESRSSDGSKSNYYSRKDNILDTKDSKDPSKWEITLPLNSHNVVVVDTRNAEQGQGWVVDQDVQVKIKGNNVERELDNYKLVEGRSIFNYGGTVNSPVVVNTTDNPSETVYTTPTQFKDDSFNKAVEEALNSKPKKPIRDMKTQDYWELANMRQIGDALYDMYGADLNNYPEELKMNETRTKNGTEQMARVDHVSLSTSEEVDKAGQGYKNGKGVTFLSYGVMPDYQRKITVPYTLIDNLSVKGEDSRTNTLTVDTTYTVSAIPSK